MKPLLLCALAALLAVASQAQVRVGADLGGSPLERAAAGSAYATAEWGVLRARLAMLDATVRVYNQPQLRTNADGTIFFDQDGDAEIVGERSGSVSRIGSTLTLGVAVPLYRGAGVGLDAGVRVYHATVETGAGRATHLPWFPVLAPEVFAPGPAGTRLHVRGEIHPAPASGFDGEPDPRLFRLTGGVSVPLRF